MIYCACTGVNTSILKEAVKNGATKLSDVYKLADQKKGKKSEKCALPQQRKVCVENLANEWANMFPDHIPSSVQKVIDKYEKKTQGSCGNDCATCPNRGSTDSNTVDIFDPQTAGEVIIPEQFSCETGVIRNIDGAVVINTITIT